MAQRIRTVALLAAALSGAERTAAEVERLDLRTCIERAIVAAPDIATAQARLATREGELDQAKSARFLPEAGLTTSLFPVFGAEGKLGGTPAETPVSSMEPFL